MDKLWQRAKEFQSEINDDSVAQRVQHHRQSFESRENVEQSERDLLRWRSDNEQKRYTHISIAQWISGMWLIEKRTTFSLALSWSAFLVKM